MITKDISIDSIKVQGIEIALPNAVLVLITAPKGFLMCGYLNLAAAEKFGECAAVIKGVKTVEQMLDSPVVEMTASARDRGISAGMLGRDALKKLI